MFDSMLIKRGVPQMKKEVFYAALIQVFQVQRSICISKNGKKFSFPLFPLLLFHFHSLVCLVLLFGSVGEKVACCPV